ncbi:MAG: hypothetical protein R2783_08940 [Gelidibacter sp.]
MRFKPSILFVMLSSLLLTLSACVKDGDFGQANTVAFSPTLKSDLILSSFGAATFMDQSTCYEQTVFADTIPMRLMHSDPLVELLAKTSLSFKFENSLDADFKIAFKFLDASNEPKYALEIPVSAGLVDTPIEVESIAIIEGSELQLFKDVTKLVYKIIPRHSDEHQMFDSNGVLELQLDATYFFDK